MPHVPRLSVTLWLEAPGVTGPGHPGHLTWICEAISVHVVYSRSAWKNIPRVVADTATRVNEKLTEARTSGLEKRKIDKVKKRRGEKKRKRKRKRLCGTTELPSPGSR
jgi:hypothetical protein